MQGGFNRVARVEIVQALACYRELVGRKIEPVPACRQAILEKVLVEVRIVPGEQRLHDLASLTEGAGKRADLVRSVFPPGTKSRVSPPLDFWPYSDYESK